MRSWSYIPGQAQSESILRKSINDRPAPQPRGAVEAPISDLWQAIIFQTKKMSGRDAVLLGLLPPVSSPYSLDRLSEAEIAAFEEARCDGFGYPDMGSKRAEIVSGLLHYPLFETDWSKHDPEGTRVMPPFEAFPIKFKIERLWLYFKNQRDRFREYLAREEPGYGDSIVEILVRDWEFKKPWYEYHALQLVEWIAGGVHPIGTISDQHLVWCGQLGRLIEQYHWRFRFEKDTITGATARKGASRGGKEKSERHKARRSEWQRHAADIWSRHPELSKLAVADNVKKQLGKAQTAKHIARYISKPASKK
jgi:hypothetical protein